MSAEPTQSDVAERAGVSRGLVSLALSDSPRVAPGTRARILSAAQELGYTRNLSAAFLAAKRSPIIGVVLPDLRNPFMENIVSALSDAAEAESLLVQVMTTSRDVERERKTFEVLRQLRVAGVVLVSPVALAEELRPLGESLNLLTIGLMKVGGHVDSVHVDEERAAHLLVEHAVRQKYTGLLQLSETSPRLDSAVTVRREAYSAAMRGAGWPPQFVDHVDEAVAFVVQRRRLAPAERWAVSAHNDLIAIDLVAALRGAGFTPGADVGVLGFDDTHLAQRPEFDITSISQDSERLAAEAVRLIRERQDNRDVAAREVIVQPTLRARLTS